MKKRLVLLLIPVIIISGLYIGPQTIPHAHAAVTGEVCIAKDGSTSCPLAPPMINSTLPPAPQLRLAVVINSSDVMTGFDVIILVDHTILSPADAVFGTLLQGTITTLIKCIGGTGSASCTSRDNANTLHYAVSASSSTFYPTTGLLFTAVYNIAGASANTPIVFQNGCTNTSVNGGLCISITSGTGFSIPETAQGAKFSNRPYFDLQPAFSAKPSLTVSRGSTDTSLTLNVTSINGFAGTVSIATPVSPIGPTATPVPPTVTVTLASPGQFSQLTVMVPSTATPGNYIINATGTATSGNAPPGALPNILTIQLIVPTPDFSISSNAPPTVVFNVSSSGSVIIMISSVGNFAGNVNLTTATTTGLNATLARTRLSLSAGGSNQTSLKITAAFPGDSLMINVTGTSGTHVHTTQVSVRVVDFVMTVSQKPLVMPQGSSSIEDVTVSSFLQLAYNVTVTFSTAYVIQDSAGGSSGPSNGLSISCNPSQVSVVATGSSTTTPAFHCLVLGIKPGNYTATIIGVAGKITNAVSFHVMVLGPDYSITAPNVQVVPVGSNVTLNVVFNRLLSLNDTLLVKPFIPLSSGLTYSPQQVNIFLNSTAPTVTLPVSIVASSQAGEGNYLLTINCQSGSSVKHSATVILVVRATASQHNLAVLSVVPSTTSTTVGSVINLAVSVQNLGKQAENATIVAIAGDQNVDQKTVLIQPGATFNYTFTWKTDGFAPGAYMVGAKVLAVPGQTNTGSNLLRAATPVTLAAANTNGILQSSLLAPIVALAAILVAVGAVVFFYIMPKRRKIVTV